MAEQRHADHGLQWFREKWPEIDPAEHLEDTEIERPAGDKGNGHERRNDVRHIEQAGTPPDLHA